MESFEFSESPIRDIEAHPLPDQERSLGLASCYEARLSSTMLVRAMDRELARRPLTTKCGRLARAEETVQPVRATSISVTPQRPSRFVQVVARSSLQTELA